jgi:hypothetical protein
MSNALEEERAMFSYLLVMVEMNNIRLKNQAHSIGGVLGLYAEMIDDQVSMYIYQSDHDRLLEEIEAGLKVEKWLRWQLSGIASSGQISGSEKATP